MVIVEYIQELKIKSIMVNQSVNTIYIDYTKIWYMILVYYPSCTRILHFGADIKLIYLL